MVATVASPRAEVLTQDQWAAALEELLEDSATDLLDGDPRLQTIFERLSEKLTEAPGEGGKELSDAKSAQRQPAVDEAAHYDICRTVWSHHDTERLCDGSSLSPYLLGVLAQTFRNYHDGSVGYVVLIKYVSASS
eukprot:s3807_g4.t1